MNDDEKRFLEQIQKENEAAHAETRRQFETTADKFAQEHAETRRQFAEFAQAIQQSFETKTAEIEQRFDSTTARIEQRFDEVARLMRRHFDTVAEDMRGDIKFLAESLAHVDHKVDVNSAKIDQLAADNEVFKAAFANVDRRLRVVEDIVLPQKPS
jgi:exonuclease VII large subunit